MSSKIPKYPEESSVPPAHLDISLSRAILRRVSRLSIADALTKDPAPPAWLVPDFLHKGTMVVIAGDAGIGKSVLSYHLSLCLASGAPFLGTKVSQSRVLYFDEENSARDAAAYLRWNWVGMGKPDPLQIDTHLRIEHFSLTAPSPAHYQQMIGFAADHKPDLIVVDTATPACRIQDENDNGEASQAMRALRAVRAAGGPETVMVILKHARFAKDTGRDIRGAKAWKGECDQLTFHVASPGRPRSNGLRPTHLQPAKTRAFGLREPIFIEPSWSDQSRSGIILTRCNPPK